MNEFWWFEGHPELTFINHHSFHIESHARYLIVFYDLKRATIAIPDILKTGLEQLPQSPRNKWLTRKTIETFTVLVFCFQ